MPNSSISAFTSKFSRYMLLLRENSVKFTVCAAQPLLSVYKIITKMILFKYIINTNKYKFLKLFHLEHSRSVYKSCRCPLLDHLYTRKTTWLFYKSLLSLNQTLVSHRCICRKQHSFLLEGIIKRQVNFNYLIIIYFSIFPQMARVMCKLHHLTIVQ